jgi:hypothetical protein
VNEISGIVYRCRLKDIGFLTLFSSFVFKFNREMGEVSGCVKILNGSKLGRVNFLHFVTTK